MRLFLLIFLVPALALGFAVNLSAADPTTLDEALERLEMTLGRYNSQQQEEWQVPTKSEHRSRPQEDEAEVLDVFDGSRIISHPFRDGESISFDEIWQWKRSVYDLGNDGSRKLTNRQVSHNVTRFSISQREGMWLANGLMLTNGVHGAMGKSAFQGTIKWHDDGFELMGTGPVSRYYAAEGKYISGTYHGSVRYRRSGDEILIQSRLQPYRLATDSEGNLMQFPDFAKPFGSLFQVDYKSDSKSKNK